LKKYRRNSKREKGKKNLREFEDKYIKIVKAIPVTGLGDP
jgi:hypothetical protein